MALQTYKSLESFGLKTPHVCTTTRTRKFVRKVAPGLFSPNKESKIVIKQSLEFEMSLQQLNFRYSSLHFRGVLVSFMFSKVDKARQNPTESCRDCEGSEKGFNLVCFRR